MVSQDHPCALEGKGKEEKPLDRGWNQSPEELLTLSLTPLTPAGASHDSSDPYWVLIIGSLTPAGLLALGLLCSHWPLMPAGVGLLLALLTPAGLPLAL
jgi:hypothetical protein